MAVELAAKYVAQDVGQAPGGPQGTAQVQYGPFTGIAVFDGEQWAALCRELDVASVGETADAALEDLQDAVREYVETVKLDGGNPSDPRRVPNADMRDFLLGHRGPEPITYLTFTTP